MNESPTVSRETFLQRRKSYIDQVRERYANILKQKNDLPKFKPVTFESSRFQECLLRFGREFRFFGLEHEDTAGIENLVNAALIEAYVRSHEKNNS